MVERLNLAILKSGMGIRIGPFDPVQLTLSVLNALMQKGVISYDEARAILKQAMGEEIPDGEKDKILDSLVVKKG